MFKSHAHSVLMMLSACFSCLQRLSRATGPHQGRGPHQGSHLPHQQRDYLEPPFGRSEKSDVIAGKIEILHSSLCRFFACNNTYMLIIWLYYSVIPKSFFALQSCHADERLQVFAMGSSVLGLISTLDVTLLEGDDKGRV